MQLRFLKYFVALAEEKHFARAAARCNVTQPTLSAGIAGLENMLGKRLVLRDRRFIDLTPEGHAALPHIRMIIAGYVQLRQATDAPGALQGELRLGAIPAAMPHIGRFVGALHAMHPGLSVAVHQLTSAAIHRRIADFELDAGLAYADKPSSGMHRVALFGERYCFATPAGGRFGARESVTLAEAVSEPLCLLHQGMQNRRILDEHLARLRIAVAPVATTDSYLALLAMVARGGLCSIVTDSHAAFVGTGLDVRLVDIDDLPEQNHIALLVLDQEPMSPIVRATLAAGRSIRDDFLIDDTYHP